MSNIGFNINSFISGSPENKDLIVVQDYAPIPAKPEEKKKRTAKKKGESTAIAPAPVPQTSMSYLQENIPYATAYQETNKQLDESINQLNALGAEIVGELQTVRASKTLRNKYGYINDMTATAASIINAKLSAIKEKNKTIHDVSSLELARLKELKNTTNQEDDDARIAKLYDAFVNTPIGVGPAALGPSMQDIMVSGGGADISRATIGDGVDATTMWEQNLDPAQNRMLLEARGSIETVVMYDDATGNRWFEVIDKKTRQPVPNVEKPDSSYIYDLDINIRGGFAKDSNRNAVYPLIVINAGADGGMSMY